MKKLAEGVNDKTVIWILVGIAILVGGAFLLRAWLGNSTSAAVPEDVAKLYCEALRAKDENAVVALYPAFRRNDLKETVTADWIAGFEIDSCDVGESTQMTAKEIDSLNQEMMYSYFEKEDVTAGYTITLSGVTRDSAPVEVQIVKINNVWYVF
ncbi:hypothetical protein FWH13_00940 [Candidatus Saccharibacteria bacterium]|nr:hypothetical protein [Candidatus Saccharibacteria bacterium]